jgi:maleamate amidohydrolase
VAAAPALALTSTVGFGEKAAVLVVDFARAFTDPALPLGSPLDDELEATADLLREARAARCPVFFTTVAYEEPDLADAGVWGRKVPANATLRAGTPAVEIDARLDVQPGEAVIVKKYASAFFGTDLVSRLNSLRVDTLLLAGCSTSGCVRASAVDGLQNGYRVLVVKEAVGDRNRAAHEQSLFDMNAKYADVIGVEEALEYLRAAATTGARG